MIFYIVHFIYLFFRGEAIGDFSRDVFAYTKTRDPQPKLKESLENQHKSIERMLGKANPLQYIKVDHSTSLETRANLDYF